MLICTFIDLIIVIVALIQIITIHVVPDLVITLAALKPVSHQERRLAQFGVLINDYDPFILLPFFLLSLFSLHLQIRVLKIILFVIVLTIWHRVPSCVLVGLAIILRHHIDLVLLRRDVRVFHVGDDHGRLIAVIRVRHRRGGDGLLLDHDATIIRLAIVAAAATDMPIDHLNIAHRLRHYI